MILIVCRFCNAQNLVPNGNFETYSSCPNAFTQLYKATPWFQPSAGTSDYFNACAVWTIDVPKNFCGYQVAHSGVGYAGIFLCVIPDDSSSLFREYCEVGLDVTLQAGVDYYFSMFVSLGDSMRYGTDALGAYFSVDSLINLNAYLLTGVVPQIENATGNFLTDKIGWTKISGKYTALGGEKYLTIGNFKHPINTNTVVALGGSADTANKTFSGGYYYLDDVCVSTDPLTCNVTLGVNDPTLQQSVSLFPNPFTNYLIINVNSKETLELTIYDLTSRKLFQQAITNSSTINTSHLSSGVYIYEVHDKSGMMKTGKITKE